MSPLPAAPAVEAVETDFDRTTAMELREDGVYTAELDESWASLRGVHGGYMSALAVLAAQQAAPGRVVRTVTTSFLRPGSIGSAELHLEVQRSGRTFDTFAVDLRQRGRTITTTRITAMTAPGGPEWSHRVTDRPAPLEDCIAFTPPPVIRHFAQAELRIDPSFIPDGTADFARVAGHVRPLHARPIDVAWMVMIGDWFPPSPFRRLMPQAGGVSIDYTIHVHRAAPTAPGEWIEGVFTAADASGGIALEHGMLCTAAGAAIAETFHTRYTGS